LANGRFPTAQHLVEYPGDPQRLLLRTTFGLLLSRDSGASWSWVCEKAVGFRDNDDPPVDVTSSGALLVGVFGGLRISRDGGCEWATAPEIKDKYVKDVSVFPNDPSKAVLVVSNGSSDGTFTNQVYKTEDDGVTWTQLGPNLPNDLIPYTLDVAPSNPSHVYVTARLDSADAGNTDLGRLLQLSAAGTAWESVPIPGNGDPYLSAVDPNDEKVVYVRMDDIETDRLVVSRDAGNTFTEAMSAAGTPGMLGFALSPDGKTVLLGVDPNGLYRAPASTLVFEQIQDFRVQCLTWTTNAIYSCSSYFLDGSFVEAGFLLGRSADNGASFSPLWRRLGDVVGPIECAAGTTSEKLCPGTWPTVQCNTLGKCPTRDAGAGSDGGPNGGSNDGGSESCSCRQVASGSAALLPLFGLLALLLRARRRSRPQIRQR